MEEDQQTHTVTHSDVHENVSEEKAPSPTQQKVRKFADEDGTMRVASKMQNMRARIGWLIERLKSN